MVRSFRFLLSRRWVLFALAIVLVAWATWWLGRWQFHRLEDRKETNSIVIANERQTPEPMTDVLGVGEPAAKDDEWRLITATGVYDTEHTIIWRYRSSDQGDAGVDVVVPLVTADGSALLVDRGWLHTDSDDRRPDVPAPAPGTVTVTGYVRVDGSGASTRVDDLSTRALSSVTAAPAIGRPAYGGWIHLHSEDPPAPSSAQALVPAELPDLSNGPHFFYGLQWWFFGVLALFGFFYLLYDEWRTGKSDAATAQRARARKDRDSVRATRLSRKQAVKAAYQAAYEKERAEKESARRE